MALTKTMLMATCKICQDSYHDLDPRDDVYQVSDRRTDAQATVVAEADSDTVFVAFRGTSSRADWVRNSEMWMAKTRFGHAHAGFLRQFRAIIDPIVQILKDLGVSTKRLVLTGHSLGGAIAVIAAPFLADVFIDKEIDVITYGAPKAANNKFRETMKQNPRIRVLQVVHVSDPVPYVPTFFMVRYRHPEGSILKIRNDATYEIVERLGASVSRCFDALTGTDEVLEIPAHQLGSYLRIVAALEMGLDA